VKQNLSNYVGESPSTFASEKGPPLADVERLKGNRRRELRNEKYPFTCTDFASPNLRIYRLSGDKIRENLPGESLAGISGGKNVGTPNSYRLPAQLRGIFLR
jgi:hypothetical protein